MNLVKQCKTGKICITVFTALAALVALILLAVVLACTIC